MEGQKIRYCGLVSGKLLHNASVCLICVYLGFLMIGPLAYASLVKAYARLGIFSTGFQSTKYLLLIAFSAFIIFRRPRLSTISSAMLLNLAVIILATIFSVNRVVSIYYGNAYLTCIFLALAAQEFFEPQQFRYFAYTLVTCATFQAIIAICQAIFIRPMETGWIDPVTSSVPFRVTGTLMNPNYLSAVLVSSVPTVIGLALGQKGKYKLLLLSVVALVVVATLLTFSRNALISLIILVVIFSIASIRKPVSLAVIACLGAAVLAVIPSPVSNRLRSSFNARDGSRVAHFALWREGIRIGVEHPLIGSGIGTFYFERHFYDDIDTKGLPSIHVHNNIITIFSESGVTGLFAYLFSIYSASRIYWRERQRPTYLHSVFLLTLIVVVTLGFFDDPISPGYPYTSLLFFISLALLGTESNLVDPLKKG